MPQIDRKDYSAEESRRYSAAYSRLKKIIYSAAPDAEEFRRELEKALAAGFPIDWPDKDGYTLLHEAVGEAAAIRAGLPQMLITAGAGVDVKDSGGRTPLGLACWWYVISMSSDHLAVIDALLAGRQNAGTRNALRESLNAATGRWRSVAGGRPELDEQWKEDWVAPAARARRDWLDVYIKTWQARGRAEDAVPAFDYVL